MIKTEKLQLSVKFKKIFIAAYSILTYRYDVFIKEYVEYTRCRNQERINILNSLNYKYTSQLTSQHNSNQNIIDRTIRSLFLLEKKTPLVNNNYLTQFIETI